MGRTAILHWSNETLIGQMWNTWREKCFTCIHISSSQNCSWKWRQRKMLLLGGGARKGSRVVQLTNYYNLDVHIIASRTSKNWRKSSIITISSLHLCTMWLELYYELLLTQQAIQKKRKLFKWKRNVRKLWASCFWNGGFWFWKVTKILVILLLTSEINFSNLCKLGFQCKCNI